MKIGNSYQRTIITKRVNKMAECITCEEEYTDKRLDLGYQTCLECGQADAVSVINARNKQVLAEIAPSSVAGDFEGSEKRDDWDENPKDIAVQSDESR